MWTRAPKRRLASRLNRSPRCSSSRTGSSWTVSWARSRARRSKSSSTGGREHPRAWTKLRSDLLRERTCRARFRFFQLQPEVRDNRPERLRGLGVRMLDDEWLAGVSADHDPRVERDSPEERKAQLLRGGLAAPDLEDVRRLAAVRTHESAHVLDDPEDVHLHGLRETDRLANVEEGHLLRGRHDDRPVRVGDLLRDAERLVARPRQQVDHEVVEVTPLR